MGGNAAAARTPAQNRGGRRGGRWLGRRSSSTRDRTCTRRQKRVTEKPDTRGETRAGASSQPAPSDGAGRVLFERRPRRLVERCRARDQVQQFLRQLRKVRRGGRA